MSHHLAILAYGSLLADPGAELVPAIVDRRPVQTPFAVEYARSSSSRCGAPTLVKVEKPGIGAPVRARLLLLRDDMTVEAARDMLYRRETNHVGEKNVTYDDERQRKRRNAGKDVVIIETLRDFEGVRAVLYADLPPSDDFLLDDAISPEDKANKLACLAIQSVTRETFCSQRDGIRYLADAICHDIHTPLTETYRAAVLRCADDAPDLETARQRIARRKDLVPEEHV